MLNDLHKPFMKLFLCRQFLKKSDEKKKYTKGYGEM